MHPSPSCTLVSGLCKLQIVYNDKIVGCNKDGILRQDTFSQVKCLYARFPRTNSKKFTTGGKPS
jgi:hypothetical protein